jgi:D-alanyl-D-alanine dipeptidase
MEANGVIYSYNGFHPAIPVYKNNGDPKSVKLYDDGSLLFNLSKAFQVYPSNDFIYSLKPQGVLLRAEAAARLIKAEASLPANMKFAILDAYRSLEEDNEIKKSRKEVSRNSLFEATLKVPPHVTGGALDLTLSFKGTPLQLGSPYNEFQPLAHIDALEHTPQNEDEASQLRRLLYKVMTEAGFAPHPFKWWHWSYGDQIWAGFYGKESSLYSEVIFH